MIIVTGTKRSGTSMWMQILGAAGLQVIGEAFPKNWKDTIYEANPHGFYESPLRGGIYYATNPDPKSGQYLSPEQSKSLAVKVFIPGLCRTDQSFMTHVVGSVRHWREYAASIERLQAMEHAANEEKKGESLEPAAMMDPVLEWWLENFALIRNLVTRRFPAHLLTYDRVIDAPEEVLPPVLQWLGCPDVEAGVAAVSPETRTQKRERIERDHSHAHVFDEFYEIIHSGEPMSNEFLKVLNQTHLDLIPAIEADFDRVFESRRRQFKRVFKRKNPLDPDAMESIIHKRPDFDALAEAIDEQEDADKGE